MKKSLAGGFGLSLAGLFLLQSCTKYLSQPSYPIPTPTTLTLSATPSPTAQGLSPTFSLTFTATFTVTPTATLTSTATEIFTGTLPPTRVLSPTPSLTPASTATPTTTLPDTPMMSPTFSTTPSPTTPLPSRTPTPTFTPINSSTPTPTVLCTSTATLGDSVGSGDFVPIINLRTYAQQYILAQSGTVVSLGVVAGELTSSYQFGIYSSDSGGNPGSLLYKSPVVSLAGPAQIPVPNLSLPAGTYWLAYSSGQEAPGTSLEGASGSMAQVGIASNSRLPGSWNFCETPVPSPTPTPVCTPPVYSSANQVVIYAVLCE